MFSPFIPIILFLICIFYLQLESANILEFILPEPNWNFGTRFTAEKQAGKGNGGGVLIMYREVRWPLIN